MSKSASQDLIDRFAQWYTPLIVVVAFLTCICPPLFSGDPRTCPSLWLRTSERESGRCSWPAGTSLKPFRSLPHVKLPSRRPPSRVVDSSPPPPRRDGACSHRLRKPLEAQPLPSLGAAGAGLPLCRGHVSPHPYPHRAGHFGVGRQSPLQVSLGARDAGHGASFLPVRWVVLDVEIGCACPDALSCGAFGVGA